MNAALLALPYEELKARREALAELILEPWKDVPASMTIQDDRIPALRELDEALAVLERARNKRLAEGR